jgi:serine/threonine protein kinase
MEVERWKRIEDLFEAARNRPADQRAAFLREASVGDPSVAAEVESLLKAASDGDSFLDGAALSSIAERPPTFKAGDTLGNFQIVSLLGRGGMGEVWRARDPRLKRDVAIKVLPAAVAQDPGRIARFEREARAASALNHANIVSVYDIGNDNGVHWIASELINGDTLRRVIESGFHTSAEGGRHCRASGRRTRGGARGRSCASRLEAGKHYGHA